MGRVYSIPLCMCVIAMRVCPVLTGSDVGCRILRLSEEVRGIAWYCVFFDEASPPPSITNLILTDARSCTNAPCERGFPYPQVECQTLISHAVYLLHFDGWTKPCAKHRTCSDSTMPS